MVWSTAHFQSRFQPTDLCGCWKGNATSQLGEVNEFCLYRECLATTSAILSDGLLGARSKRQNSRGFKALLNRICGLTGLKI